MSFLGTLGKGLVGAVGGFLTGGPAGAVRGTIAATRPRPAGAQFPMIAPPGPLIQRPGVELYARQLPDVPRGFPGAVPQPGFRGGLERFLPGGQSGYQGAPPGYHINKRYLAYVRAEQFGKDVQDPTREVQVKNVIVKNRRMNPLNPDALRRANSRQIGAVRLMRRVLRGSGYTIGRPRAKFGAKARRR